MADVKPATPEEVEEFRNAVANLLSFGRRCIVITDEGRQRLLARLDAERRAREEAEAERDRLREDCRIKDERKTWLKDELDRERQRADTESAWARKRDEDFAKMQERAEAAERKVAELEARLAKLDLSSDQVDELLARWDLTESGLQRQIVARFAALFVESKDRVAELEQWRPIEKIPE